MRDGMDETMDRALATMLDGNAAAGLLQDIFGADMTSLAHECGSCGTVAEIGTTDAWMEGPGVVLRCSACHEVIIRIVETPRARLLDARGAAWIRLPRG
jgi:hypothetical protein